MGEEERVVAFLRGVLAWMQELHLALRDLVFRLVEVLTKIKNQKALIPATITKHHSTTPFIDIRERLEVLGPVGIPHT